MAPPTVWMTIRQTLGRAFRETGQTLDRLGILGSQHAVTKRIVGDDPSIFDDHLSRHRHQMPLLERGRPLVSSDAAFLAPCSTLIGSVRVGSGASIWYGAILRADSCENGLSLAAKNDDTKDEPWTRDEHMLDRAPHDPSRWIGGGIYVGENSNVQDGCIISSRQNHTVIGKGVTIGHLAQIHSATIQDNCLIGMGSMIMEGCVVESESFIAAGAVIRPDTTVPSGELWAGNPARKLRDLTPEEIGKIYYQADEYVKVATGQQGVMELGGNMPDSLIEHLLIGGASAIPAHRDEPQNAREAQTIKSNVRPLEETLADDEVEEEEPLKASAR